MEKEVKAGRFREDLYYRINVMSLQLPPLRNRDGDIQLLVKAFLSDDWEIEPAALEAIEKYHWPGNVRQLINALERAQIMADDGMIRSYDLPPEVLRPETVDGSEQKPSEDELASIQRSHIVEVLRREQGNKARTARKLGINRRSLYRLLEKYQIGAVDLSETV
jgi:transcriptional regulator with PAS, ATPase and Fis domain